MAKQLITVVISLAMTQGEIQQIGDVLKHINPPGIPFFNGEVRIVAPPYSNQLVAWLEEKEQS